MCGFPPTFYPLSYYLDYLAYRSDQTPKGSDTDPSRFKPFIHLSESAFLLTTQAFYNFLQHILTITKVVFRLKGWSAKCELLANDTSQFHV